MGSAIIAGTLVTSFCVCLLCLTDSRDCLLSYDEEAKGRQTFSQPVTIRSAGLYQLSVYEKIEEYVEDA